MPEHLGLKLLFAKAAALEATKDKLRSELVKTAIKDLIEVLHAIEGSNRKVIATYNDTKRILKKEEERKMNEPATKKVTGDVETQYPCWWDIHPPQNPQNTQQENDVQETEQTASTN